MMSRGDLALVVDFLVHDYKALAAFVEARGHDRGKAAGLVQGMVMAAKTTTPTERRIDMTESRYPACPHCGTEAQVMVRVDDDHELLCAVCRSCDACWRARWDGGGYVLRGDNRSVERG